jgi:streptogramin lyase
MRASKIRTSFIPAFFFLLLMITSFAGTSQAQTISPPPTAAGYPFWKSFDPGKITRGNDGAVWFAGSNGMLGRLSLTGSLKTFTVEPLNSPNGEGAIQGIYWGPDNNVWYGTFSGIVGKLNPTTGAVTRFQLPERVVFDITRGPDGNMWATVGASVYRISTAGAFTAFSLGGRDSGAMLRPGPDGNMWIMETFGRRIYHMNTAGRILNVFSLTDPHVPTCGLTCAGITAGPDGNMWFTQNDSFPQIGRITMSGQITYFPLPGKGATDIAWVHDGNIWFSDPDDRLIARISPATGVITYFEPVGQDHFFSVLRAISSASDGNLYFTGIKPDPATGDAPGVGKIPLSLPEHAIGTNIYPTHARSFSGSVAGFSDFETINGSFFNATIHWGDGTSSKGTVTRVLTGNPSEFQVHGSHTYAKKGKFTVTINVSEPGDQYSFRMQAVASVQ